MSKCIDKQELEINTKWEGINILACLSIDQGLINGVYVEILLFKLQKHIVILEAKIDYF